MMKLSLAKYFALVIVACLPAGNLLADDGLGLSPADRSAWVGESASTPDNYYFYNCSDNDGYAGYLTETLSGGKKVPGLTSELDKAEMFFVEPHKEYFRIKRLNEESAPYLYSGGTLAPTCEFSTTVRDFNFVQSNGNVNAVANGLVYEIRYHDTFLAPFRYFCSNGSDRLPGFTSNPSNYRWVLISERQFEFRPKLDAAIAMVKHHNPTGNEPYYAVYQAARAVQTETTPQQAGNTIADEMLVACNNLIIACLDASDDEEYCRKGKELWQTILEASDLATRLKRMTQEAPADIKSAVARAFDALVTNNKEQISWHLNIQNDGNGNNMEASLRYVYRSYLDGSLDVYADLIRQALAIGYTLSDDYNERVAQCRTPEDYERLAADVRADMKRWLSGRLEAGQGFPKGTNLSMLLVNNSFELGSTNGWTVGNQGYWIMQNNNDVTVSQTNSWNSQETGILRKDSNPGPASGMHGEFCFRAYDIHECTKGNNDYNINHGYEVWQEISGLPAGTYEASALVALVPGNLDYSTLGKQVCLQVNVGQNAQPLVAETECDKESFKSISQTFSVSSPSDVVRISIYGKKLTEAAYSKDNKTYVLSYYIPFLLDNLELKLMDVPDQGTDDDGQDAEEVNQGTAFTFDESDSSVPSFVANAEYSRVVVKRSIKSSEYWNTLCLPFALNEKLTSQYFSDVRELSGLEVDANDNATLSFRSVSSVEAGKPYLVKVNADSCPNGLSQIEAVNVAMVKEPEPTEFSINNGALSVRFEGVFYTIYGGYLPNSGMILQNNSFYLVSQMSDEQREKTRIKGFRAFFSFDSNVSSEAPNFRLDFEEESSSAAIETMSPLEKTADRVYDLCGRAGEQPLMGRGLYILNGKTRFMK